MQRARQPEQKEDRKRDILMAARHCFMANSHQLPSAAQVAQQAGVAKGTVYLYFKTKEEIFLALMVEQLEQVFSSIAVVNNTNSAPEHLAHCMTQYIQAHPEFMPLACMLYSVLEANIPVEVLYTFKLKLSQGLSHSARVFDQHYHLPHGFSQTALLQSYAAMIGLWQMLTWPPALTDFKNQPEFSALQLNFNEQLRDVFSNIWRC